MQGVRCFGDGQNVKNKYVLPHGAVELQSEMSSREPGGVAWHHFLLIM